jgi:SAM-dependent methyltransferase
VASSFIPTSAWRRRLTYELIYLAFGFARSGMFNVGFAPARQSIAENPAFAVRPTQIELYAQLFDRVPWDADRWRRSDWLELAAGCGGGLLYLGTQHSPRSALGVELSHVAAWRGRRQGVDVRQGDATQLSLESGRFDGVVCLEAMVFLPETALMGAFRILKPGGILLCGESFAGNPETARDYYHRRARVAGFELTDCHDATAGVQRSLQERSSSTAPFVHMLPRFMRDPLKETLSLDGSDRLRHWSSGAMSFVITTFRRPD